MGSAAGSPGFSPSLARIVSVAVLSSAGLTVAYAASPREASAQTATREAPPQHAGVASMQPVRSPFDHDWRQVFGQSWQIESAPRETTRETDAREGTRGACKPGMVEVSGKMIGAGAIEGAMIELLQDATCSRWITQSFPERCATFSRGKWLALSARLPRREAHFCIDRYEYPNVVGEYPVIDINFRESAARCKSEGKRLCTEDEWTFACEGEEAMPYPTGYERPANECVIDRPWQRPDEVVLDHRSTFAAMLEVGRLWQGEASGSRPRCKSAFGVYDMTGNVDEWTRSSVPGERPSVLKGGYWGPVRTRCRPATKKHGESHAFYQQGFRCCADTPK
jgi:hypothetical protein